MQKSDRYYCHNRWKYCLKVHIVLVTKYRKPLLLGNFSSGVKAFFSDIAEKKGWKILAIETDADHIHVLLEYDTTERICDIVKELKQKSTYYLWEQFACVLKNEYWKKHSGLMGILHAALEKYQKTRYSITSKIKVDLQVFPPTV